MTGNDDLDFAGWEILLRRTGHEILLQPVGSVSRVLPVKKIAKNEYQVSFENVFTFHPESLLNTTPVFVSQRPPAWVYVFNLLNCGNASVAYGAILKNKKDDIITCIGKR